MTPYWAVLPGHFLGVCQSCLHASPSRLPCWHAAADFNDCSSNVFTRARHCWQWQCQWSFDMTGSDPGTQCWLPWLQKAWLACTQAAASKYTSSNYQEGDAVLLTPVPAALHATSVAFCSCKAACGLNPEGSVGCARHHFMTPASVHC